MHFRSRTLEAFYGDIFEMSFAGDWPEIPQQGDVLTIDDNNLKMERHFTEDGWEELEEPLGLSGTYRVTQRDWVVVEGRAEFFGVLMEPVNLWFVPDDHPLMDYAKTHDV